MFCPYCLTKQTFDVKQCIKCEREIPKLYQDHYPRGWRRKEPVFISVVGFRGHGKTVYLASLLHALDKQLPDAWDKFFRQALDQQTLDTLRKNRQLLEHGQLPPSTSQTFPAPSIHRLAKLPGDKDRVVVIYDPPGEAFERDTHTERYASFVAHSKTVLFLISLSDLGKSPDDEMDRLLNTYTVAMARLKSEKTRRRRKSKPSQDLIVVYTKADLLIDTCFKHYGSVVSHLQNPAYIDHSDYKAYQATLKGVSEELSDFTRNEIRANNFVNLADEAFNSIRYCAVSALGSAPKGEKLKDKMTPIRVVDPLLWVLALE